MSNNVKETRKTYCLLSGYVQIFMVIVELLK